MPMTTSSSTNVNARRWRLHRGASLGRALFGLRSAAPSFAADDQRDLAQAVVIKVHVQLVLERPRAYHLQRTIDNLGPTWRDLERGGALRTEAAVPPSAWCQAEDPGGPARVVMDVEVNQGHFTWRINRHLAFWVVDGHTRDMDRDKIVTSSRAQKP